MTRVNGIRIENHRYISLKSAFVYLMSMNILIRGRPGSGKSTAVSFIIRKVRNAKEDLKIGGIVTPEIRLKGRRTGFKVVDLLTGDEMILASVSLQGPRVGKYFVDVRGFDEFLEVHRRSWTDSELIVVDEIGKMELLSETFKRYVLNALNLEKPVVATAPYYRLPFLDEILRRKDVEVVWMKRGLAEAIASEISERVIAALGL